MVAIAWAPTEKGNSASSGERELDGRYESKEASEDAGSMRCASFMDGTGTSLAQVQEWSRQQETRRLELKQFYREE